MDKIIDVPPHLSPEAAEIYRGIVEEFGIDDIAGRKILRIACEAFDRAQACRREIEKDGMLLEDDDGVQKTGALFDAGRKTSKRKPHPLLPIERDSRAGFLAGMKALNLDLEPLRDKPGRPPGK